VATALAAAGCVAADEEAAELVAAAADAATLDAMVDRRVTGEPLAWITGTAPFCGLAVRVRPGVYVPRWQSEVLATTAARLLPERGTAVDLCTGSGAVALVLQAARPGARVLATESDPRAAACARSNGVDVCEGDLDAPLPADLVGTVDVVCGVVPYVPTDALHLLPRDVTAHEPRTALDGGPGGLTFLSRAVAAAARLLVPGGWLLLEAGGEQFDPLAGRCERTGFTSVEVLRDGDGDPRAVRARRTPWEAGPTGSAGQASSR
jgi:release factor glutamine methyltransferase